MAVAQVGAWSNTPELTKHPLFTIIDESGPGSHGEDDKISIEVGTPTKYEGNPLRTQDRPWEPRIDNGYPNVIHDPDVRKNQSRLL